MQAIVYYCIVSLFWLLSLLPLRLARGLGVLIGHILWWSHSVARQTTETNLRLCFPDLGKAERRQLAKRSLQHLGMTVMESGLVWGGAAEQATRLIADVKGVELIEAALSEGKGLILLGPHTGNWELVGLYLAGLRSLTIMYQPPEHPAVDRFIRRARTRNGVKLVPTSTSGVKGLLRSLKRGELVAVLPDQVPPPNSGVFAPFFGEPALTVSIVYNLVQRTGAKVLLCYALRSDQGDFQLAVMEPPASIYDADELAAVTALNRGVEAVVEQAPEQYQWEYKRFRKRPEGVPNPYRR